MIYVTYFFFFFFQAEDGIRDRTVTGVQTCALPISPAGQTYQAWARHGATWTSLGTVEPDAGGSARLIAEDPALAALPDGLEVTLEPRTGSAAPSGPVVVAWVP